MSKYSAFRYGTNTLYGTGAVGTQPTYTGELIWVCGVEWSGSYSGVSEAMLDYSMERGAGAYLSASGGGFEPQRVGRMTVKLDNFDGRYDPYNSSSPLYPNVAPGKKIFVDAVSTSTGTHYRRFTGTIDNISFDSLAKTATLDCVDNVQLLERDDVAPATMFQTNTTSAINATLDAVGWGAGRRIQTSDNPLTLFSVEEQNALYTVDMLSQGSLGYWYVAADGAFVYYDRDYTGMTAHSVDQSTIAKDLPLKAPWETTRRNITVYANRWARTPLKQVWYLDAITVNASATATIDVRFANPAEIIPPVSGTDYSNPQVYNGVTNNGDGTFTINPTITGFTVTISGITPRGATLSITNNSSLQALTINGIQIRGREYINSWSAPQKRSSAYAWVKEGPSTQISTKRKYTGTSTALTGKFVLDNEFLQDANFASAFQASITSALGTPDKAPMLRFDTRYAQSFIIELGDKITVTSAKLGINGDFYALKITERWTSETGQGYETIVTTGRRIFCTASITPEPVIEGGTPPELPYNPPPITPPPGQPNVPTPTAACLLGDTVSGPYPLTFDKTFLLPGQTAYAMLPCTLRAGTVTNKSLIDLTDVSFTTVTIGGTLIQAVDANQKPIIAAGAITTTGTYPILKKAEFTPVNTQAVAGFSVTLASSPPVYYPGDYWFTDEGLGSLYAGYGGTFLYGPSWPNHANADNIAMKVGGTAGPGTWGTEPGFYFDVSSITGSGPIIFQAHLRTSAGLAYVQGMGSTDGVNWSAYFQHAIDDKTDYSNFASFNDVRGYKYVGWQAYNIAFPDQIIYCSHCLLVDMKAGFTGSLTLANVKAWNVC